MNPILQKGESVTVTGLHIATNKFVDIKFISKTDLSVTEVELLRDQVQMYKISVHYSILRLLDYFESKENFILCLERRDLENM